MGRNTKSIKLESLIKDVAFEFIESLWKYFHMREKRFRTFLKPG